MTKAEILKKHNMTEQEFYAKYPTQESYIKEFGNGGMMKSSYADGGSIHIKPENRGKFTAYKERTGKTTEEALHSPNAHVRQMANFARNAAKWKHADGGMMSKTSTRITPEITRLSKGGKLMTYDNGGNLSYQEQLSLQNNQANLDKQKTEEERQYQLQKAKENQIGSLLSSGINTIGSTTGLSNTGNSTLDFYNNKINKENKVISGLTSTGLGIAGTLIGGPAGGAVGSSLGKAVGGLFEQGGPLTKYSGLTHSEGGIALGNTGNEVEDKETRIGDFIFSKKLNVTKNISFADMSKKIEKQTIGKRDNDKISKETFNRKISNLASAQEVSKAINNKTNNINKFEYGTDDLSGKNPYSNPYRDNSYLLPYTSDVKPNFMDIPSSITTPIEKPNNSRFNFEPIEPKNPIPIIESIPEKLKPLKPKNPFLPYSPTWPVKQEETLIKKDIKGEPKDITEPVKEKEKRPLNLSWLNPAAQLGLTALGNYKPLTVKNYQMKPDLLDSTQAKKENRDIFSGINSDLATSGLTGGQYMASRMGSAAQQAAKNAEIDNQYRSANVGIKNQFRQLNTATDKEVQELNAKETDASKTARQFRNQNMAGILGGYGADKARQASAIPAGHVPIYDIYGNITGYRNKVTGVVTSN